jgi:hypothetical protein
MIDGNIITHICSLMQIAAPPTLELYRLQPSQLKKAIFEKVLEDHELELREALIYSWKVQKEGRDQVEVQWN